MKRERAIASLSPKLSARPFSARRVHAFSPNINSYFLSDDFSVQPHCTVGVSSGS
jgi:hypothetical protein